ncbi:hypothetical protein LOTGIDRAFT_173609 [Lottia gigantea]|uniref:Uncharacterized protein n=1 Tax=Lottia gigantea TaxID=225164 RepID=V4AQZ2_LOTGI|nr:hypothetical protein LOTGIDRAFT_173609 [Lottia gigantea]ESO99667.1 hypothetical protein LOTGIDRAFT_173609 [Lottia gigantea]
MPNQRISYLTYCFKVRPRPQIHIIVVVTALNKHHQVISPDRFENHHKRIRSLSMVLTLQLKALAITWVRFPVFNRQMPCSRCWEVRRVMLAAVTRRGQSVIARRGLFPLHSIQAT